MSRKKHEIVHWTLLEEKEISDAIPAIQKESGKFFLSGKSKTYLDLKRRFSNRSPMAFNAKLRSMLREHQEVIEQRPLLHFDSEEKGVESQDQWDPNLPASSVGDKVLREFYGEVSFESFMEIQSTISKFK